MLKDEPATLSPSTPRAIVWGATENDPFLHPVLILD